LTTELRQARERNEDTHRQLVAAQAREAELQRALQRSGDELARTTSQFIEVQKSLAFRLASRLSDLRARLAPEQSWRYRLYQKSIGFGCLLRRAVRTR
jgi:septal ring factor EnvC (AmiA/AmiB activator)